MEVLKIVGEGLTTSFRYPHFMQGVQPTFEVPPPATIYGHICSALGEWVNPEGIEFAYHFTFKARFDDVEHTHLVSGSGGYLPGTKIPKVLAGNINPFKRSILFAPRLILYINRPDWAGAFRSPRYPVVLGRSQDLFTYREVSVVELERSESAYFEHTLAPFRFALTSGRGYSVLMPRFLDYKRNRKPVFARYHVLRQRVYGHDLIQYENGNGDKTFLVDPYSEESRGARLGLLFHSFVGEYEDDPYMADLAR
jgi:CRISPR-associated protein Cas5t